MPHLLLSLYMAYIVIQTQAYIRDSLAEQKDNKKKTYISSKKHVGIVEALCRVRLQLTPNLNLKPSFRDNNLHVYLPSPT